MPPYLCTSPREKPVRATWAVILGDVGDVRESFWLTAVSAGAGSAVSRRISHFAFRGLSGHFSKFPKITAQVVHSGISRGGVQK